MRLRLLSLALALGLLSTLIAAPLAANAAQTTVAQAAPNPLTNIPITGSIPGLTGGAFTGTLNITSFAVQNGQLVANGLLTGALTQTVNGVTTTVGNVTNFPVQLPVTASGSCQILHLDLGPLNLTLLGLMVHLNQVVLDITAQQGPGNLLGNLLCAVAHLLDNPVGTGGALNGIADLLNQILAIL